MLVSEHAISVLILALILDRILGDPDWLWSSIKHPVTVFGNAIGWFDTGLNRPEATDSVRRRNGFISIGVLVIAAALSGTILTLLFDAVIYGWVLETVLVAVLLAQKSLLDHVRRVAQALRDEGVPAGRKAVSMIVGRDVAKMDRSDISRAAIESTAENFSDGTISPAFWYLVGGLPGLLVYKIVNTADSMIGHRNETYLQFGFAAARLDDILNYVPARISAALIALVAPVQDGSTIYAVDIISRDASSHASPNAGWPETAIAGAMDIALGGPRSYGSEYLNAPWLNADGEHDLSSIHIDAATSLIETAWFLVLIALTATQIPAFL